MSKLSLNKGVGQKGFTLIEMSIVLVIIGLIIGGILKGQEVIESSRQKNFINQVDSIRSSVTTFAERFNGLPGDFNCATTAGACAVGRIAGVNAQILNGGGNGIIGNTAANTAAMDTSNRDAAGNEELQFWVHLNQANLLGGTAAVNTTPVAFGGDNAIPASAFPSSGLSMVHGTYNSTTPKLTHWLQLHRTAGAAATAALSPKQMFAIDQKMDDGTPGAGTFRTGALNATATNCGLIAGVTSDYGPTNETIQCIAYVELIQ